MSALVDLPGVTNSAGGRLMAARRMREWSCDVILSSGKVQNGDICGVILPGFTWKMAVKQGCHHRFTRWTGVSWYENVSILDFRW